MKKIILLLFVPLFMAGCVKEEDFRLHRVENVSVSLGSTTAINAVLVVENMSRRNVTISDVKLYVADDRDREIAVITVAEELHIPKKSITNVAVPLRVRFSNPLLGLGMLGKIEESASRMTINGKVRIKAGAYRKNVAIKNVPLSQFIPIFTKK